MSDTADWVKTIGAHEIRCIAPDVVHCVLRGVLNDNEAEVLIATIQGHADQVGRPLYAIYDLSNFVRLTIGVRNIALHGDYADAYAAVAIVGASFTTRTFVDMFARAGKLVTKKSFGFEHKFLPTLEEAHAWFGELRKESHTP